MPRVANLPRVNQGSNTSPFKQSSVEIPFNDDRREKAVRFQSRQALQNLQMNQIKVAASPMRKLSSCDRAVSESPKTPQGQRRQEENRCDEGGLLPIVGGGAMTPMKRVPILANFEEWMKMATDNKINATNSWNFALIDYFHDMSLLKEGDGVNFQKASCTLDGCVKIYTSRVDSVATETGKLLSGLADSGSKKQHGNEDDETNGEDDEGEDGVIKKTKKRIQRSSEATLAASFAALQLKKFELEFSIDPLFKKASADFDEGGAKGLLLNHLAIDNEGRIVFDSSDEIENTSLATPYVQQPIDQTTIIESSRSGNDRVQPPQARDFDQCKEDLDLQALKSRFLPDLSQLDKQEICPPLKNFDHCNPSGILNIPFHKASEKSNSDKGDVPSDILGDHSGIMLDENNAAGFDDDEELLGGFEMPADTGFGEGGEIWARDAALQQPMRLGAQGPNDELADHNEAESGVAVAGFDSDNSHYGVALQHEMYENGHQNILQYFDNALKKSWAGPEHWKIQRMKTLTKVSSGAPLKRKEKEPFVIDFAAPLDPAFAELIYTSANSNSALCLPKTQWRSKSRNLLPDDKHFNSRQLLQLFLKPKARVGSKKSPARSLLPDPIGQEDSYRAGELNEAYWATQGIAQDPKFSAEPKVEGDYDANFFQDDGLVFPDGVKDDDDDEFADAREAFSSGANDIGFGSSAQGIDAVLAPTEVFQERGFGSQLVTQCKRLRPEYVRYARIAKKVDVRRLKEEMWKGIGFEEVKPSPPSQLRSTKEEPGTLKFTTVMNSLQTVYPRQSMADISTSYCFICLLHLANEKGLTLGNEEGLEELSIRRDFTAEITVGGG